MNWRHAQSFTFAFGVSSSVIYWMLYVAGRLRFDGINGLSTFSPILFYAASAIARRIADEKEKKL